MLPDFIIAGAMKCGTTSLYNILKKQPNVFMSTNKEPHFFDMDDLFLHADYFMERGNWKVCDWNKNNEEKIKRYKSLFEGAKSSQVVGEATTAYISAEKAPERMKEIIPNVKLIFMLRDPVKRAYSHYWHVVRAGKAIHNFKNTLKYSPHTLLRKGRYYIQLKRYLRCFDEDQIHFMVFEEFVNNMEEEMNKVYDFLEIEEVVPLEKIDTKAHPSKVPRVLPLQLFLNRFIRGYRGGSGGAQFCEGQSGKKKTKARSMVNKVGKSFYKGKLENLYSTKNYPDMDEEVREFLEEFYESENRGLSELIGRNLSKWWSISV